MRSVRNLGPPILERAYPLLINCLNRSKETKHGINGMLSMHGMLSMRGMPGMRGMHGMQSMRGMKRMF